MGVVPGVKGLLVLPKKKETVGGEVIKSLSVVLKPLRDLVVDERDKVQR